MSVLRAVAVALLAFPRMGFAQTGASGDTACGQVLDEVAPGCVEIALAEAELEELEQRQRDLEQKLGSAATPASERPPAQQELDQLRPRLEWLESSIEALKDTPFEQLPGFCSSFDANTPRTCDALATRLGAFDEASLEPLARATKAKAADAKLPEADAALVRNAAASDRRTANNKSGSSAQLDPVESIQPITVAGGAFTLSGTRSGSKGVGTISVNPLALAAPSDVVAARVMDVSVSAPFDLEGNAGNNDPYVSARLRVNVTAPFNAAQLKTKVDAWLSASGAYADDLEQVLLHAKDTKGCALHIAQYRWASASACEQDVTSAHLHKARLEAFAEIERARRAADQCYLGVDARFDTGDPTGRNIAGDLGTHGLLGLAAGLRLPQGRLWDWELRGRVAGDVFQSRDPLAGPDPDVVFSFDWGGAVLFSGRLLEIAKQRMAFGVGLEGRHALAQDEAAKLSPTNYVQLNFMAVVPALTGGDVGLAIGVPVRESREARGLLVNFSTDLGLLDHSL